MKSHGNNRMSQTTYEYTLTPRYKHPFVATIRYSTSPSKQLNQPQINLNDLEIIRSEDEDE